MDSFVAITEKRTIFSDLRSKVAKFLSELGHVELRRRVWSKWRPDNDYSTLFKTNIQALLRSNEVLLDVSGDN